MTVINEKFTINTQGFTDIIDITQEFFKNDRKSFQKFIKKLDSVDQFIEHVNFKVAIVVSPD